MLLWQQWQADYGPQPVSSNEVESATVESTDTQQLSTDDLPDQADDLVPSPSQTGGTSEEQSATAGQTAQLVQVDTDVIRAMIYTRGGVIRSLKLKQYPTSLEQPDDWHGKRTIRATLMRTVAWMFLNGLILTTR